MNNQRDAVGELPMKMSLLSAMLLLGVSSSALAASVFTTRLDDPRAVYLTTQEFGAKADGRANDSAAIQAAIDKAAGDAHEGIVFVPSGATCLRAPFMSGQECESSATARRARSSCWRTTRRVFRKAWEIWLCHRQPSGARSGASGRIPFPPPGTVPANDAIADAGPSTFYSAMSNIDFEIGEGNPAAIAIRFHVAQHAYLSHMDFHIGSGLAALTEIGNEAEDLHFYGGRYAILTTKPRPPGSSL